MSKRILMLFSIVLVILAVSPSADAQRKAASSRKSTTQMAKKQNGKITGSVRYKFNDYQGYKIDVGAVVYAVHVDALQDILSYDDIKKYEDLAEKKTHYRMALNELDGNKTFASMASHYSEGYDNMLEDLDSKMFDFIASVPSKKINMALIDSSGIYSMELPYGEYYIVFKSKNRERMMTSELTGRIHVEKINLNTPTELVECDFDY